MPQEIKVSLITVWEAIILILGLYFIFLLRDLVLLIFVAFILMAVLNPAVDFLEDKKLPRWFSILLLYFLTVSTLVLILPLVINPLISESQNFIKGFPAFFSDFLRSFKLSFVNTDQFLNNQDLLLRFLEQIVSAPLILIKVGAEIFGGVISLVSVLVIAFYLLLDGARIKKFWISFFEKEKGERLMKAFVLIEKKLGDWLRGELVLMTAVGLMTFIGLSVLGVKFALPLSVLAGLLEIVPTIGPVTSTLPPFIMAVSESPIKGLAVFILFLLVQQSENHLLVPQIMRGAVGLHPLLVILSVWIGAKLLGPSGAILAVPLAVVFWVIFEEFFAKGRYNALEK